MPDQGTWEEADGAEQRKTSLLVHVLSYDDLLATSDVTLELPEGVRRISLGRAPDAPRVAFRSTEEIGIPDKWVSNHHAVIVRQSPDRFGPADLVSDDGSRNGTYVNGSKVTASQRLVDGDLVEVGHSVFCYRTVDADVAAYLQGRAQPPRVGPTTTRCPEVATLVRDLERIAPSREPVLVLGETGSGKEVVARMIHDLSGRRGAYGTIDCGAVPESLFEATFFGHRRGAFTGAAESRIGEIARADGGTLFLDEVANMSTSSQSKLLRVIEDGLVTPLGASEPQRVDVRWVAATNSPHLADESAFRADLLRRLAGCVARVPPLRKRREDIGALAAHLLREAGFERVSITAPAGRQLFCDPFPGNVRQLRTMLRGAATLAGDGPIDRPHLSAVEAPARREGAGDAEVDPEPAPARGRRKQRNGTPDATAIDRALLASGGNVVRAAAALEAHPRQLYRWIERLAVPLEKYRR